MIIDQAELITIPAGTSIDNPHPIRNIDPSRLSLVLQARTTNAASLFVGTKKKGAFIEFPVGVTFGRDIFSPANALYVYGTAGDQLYISEGYENK